ncbi:hypothetical protein [Klebsiella quasipneumoniae]|uniref:hypothetical protein n=1 Tax=Klebsiella quasipneumoniae TaxID=1463165 RepID=UPI003F6DCAE2
MLDFRWVVKNRKIQPEAAFFPTKNQGLEWMNSNPRMQIAEKTMAEWFMLLLLAGNAGERSHTGHESLGSSNDHARWLKTADSYLSNLTRGIYHMHPKTKEQVEHNESKLIALKAEQQLMLDLFFDINRSVHNDMVNELRSRTFLKGDELFKFLDRVVLPEAFPRPKKELIQD